MPDGADHTHHNVATTAIVRVELNICTLPIAEVLSRATRARAKHACLAPGALMSESTRRLESCLRQKGILDVSYGKTASSTVATIRCKVFAHAAAYCMARRACGDGR
jgi:hypothetical protein